MRIVLEFENRQEAEIVFAEMANIWGEAVKNKYKNPNFGAQYFEERVNLFDKVCRQIDTQIER